MCETQARSASKGGCMKATKKLRILSSIFIVLGLLLGTSLDPARAQGPGKENFTAPGPKPMLRPIAEQVSLSGWFSIIWGDSKDGKSSMIYTLTDVNGQRTLLQLDEKVAKRLGGVLQFNGKYVTVQGTLAAPSNTSAIPGSTESPPAVLNVISIGLASPPGSRAPAIDVTADVTPLALVSGSKPWITIMCKFSDQAGEPNDLAYFQGMYGDTKPGLNHYWKEVSFNTADVTGSTTGTGWYNLPDPVVHYNPTLSPKGADKTAVAIDCINAADATVDFSLYDGINMMFNFDFDYGWAWGGGWNATLDGVTKTWSITWEPPWAYADISVIAHEMGHGFGLPHSTAIDRDPDHVYDNAWDVMSWDRYNCAAGSPFRDATYGCMAQHTISYHKDLLGWIPGVRKTTIAGPVSTTTLILEDLAAPASGNFQMAIIPIGGSATNFYTVEARQFTGYDAKLPDEAVIIHNVDTTEGIPALLVPALNSTDPDVWFTAGEIFHDATNNIAVKVNSATGTGFEVTILNGNHAPTSDAGGPYTQECGGPTTIVALDGSGSSDPEELPLTYAWTTNCPGGTFNNSAIAQPILTINTSAACAVSCNVSLIVTDNEGLPSASDSATVTIQDTTPPVIACPDDITIECNASSDPTNTGTATATDVCNPGPSISYVDGSAPGSCPQNSTISRSWTATDICGNAASCVQTIHIVDTTPPVLSPLPADVTLECDDPVPPPPTVTATDNCDSSVPTIFNEQRINGSCPSNYELIRTWTATDDCGNTATHVQTITVQDTTPPVIHNVAAQPNVLWPPNHKMVHVEVTAIATDNCDPAPHCHITSVNSNEPINGPGDGNTVPDWIITGDLTMDLRAERSGIGKGGRIYMITVTCSDICGNSSARNTTVMVPHDQKKK
jgi:M6 family metalloprotease-like protein